MNYENEISQAFDDTYQTIAFDLCGGDDDGCIGRVDLFEICCDFLDSYGEMEDDVKDFWKSLDYDSKKAYIPIVFPYDSYEIGVN